MYVVVVYLVQRCLASPIAIALSFCQTFQEWNLFCSVHHTLNDVDDYNE